MDNIKGIDDALKFGAKIFSLEKDESSKFIENQAGKIKNDRAELEKSKLGKTQNRTPTLHIDALYGIVGKIIELFDPHTEASLVAILIQFLTMIGNAVGRNPHFIADGKRHGANLFVAVVGATSAGRKGTSWANPRKLLSQIDETWEKEKIESGLSSGEGLISVIRDPIISNRLNSDTGEHEEVIEDPGVEDKRVLIFEAEFANVLKVIQREGNTLSPIVRCAWDGDTIGTLTKNKKTKATDPHISIVGHITPIELTKNLSETESANGFGNRFLWFHVHRSKRLPSGGNIENADFNEVISHTRRAIEFARNIDVVKRSAEANAIWNEIYEDLSEDKPGLLGSMTARGCPQVLRIAMIYALLDLSSEISAAHLKAALAIWEYSIESCRGIFGNSTGNNLSDRIMAALKEVGPKGLSRTEIRDLFNRNKGEGEISKALQILDQANLAICRLEHTGGRKVEIWQESPTTETTKAKAESYSSSKSFLS